MQMGPQILGFKEHKQKYILVKVMNGFFSS
jgi:hypothetical protein